MKRLLIIWYLTFAAGRVLAHNPEPLQVVTLPNVWVSADKIKKYTAGQKTEIMDSASIASMGAEALGELLYRQTALNINRYNHNGLNLLSVRGTTAAQSNVYWNGFQLSPPNNGLIDLSIVPANYFNNVSILYGGSSSLYGSGNIGAGIHLNNQPVFKKQKKLHMYGSAASFHDYSGFANASYANPKWFVKSQFSNRTAQNDFTYKNLDGEKKTFENARLKQLGFMQDIYRRFNNRNITGVSFWYQQNHKQVPATLTSKPTDAYQTDQAWRGIFSTKQFIYNGFLSGRIALFNDFQNYIDPDSIPVLEINSQIETLRLQADVSLNKQLGKSTLVDAGIEFSHLSGTSANYAGQVTQRQAGLYLLASQRFANNKWITNLKIRQDFNTDFTMPFIPSFGIEGRLYRNLTLKGTVSRNFRIPTFNDLYWIPGGNTALKPETSWNEDIGLVFKNDTISRVKFGAEITAFNSVVENWIMWVPNGALWSPMNIRQVWARGAEASFSLRTYLGKVKSQLAGSYSFTKSTNEKKLFDNDPVYKKQLIYIPLHRFRVNLGWSYARWDFNINQSYTGERFVTAGNTESIDDYALVDVQLQKAVYIKNNQLVIQAQVLNVFNNEYQAVLYYPMPQRSFKISIQLIIQY